MSVHRGSYHQKYLTPNQKFLHCPAATPFFFNRRIGSGRNHMQISWATSCLTLGALSTYMRRKRTDNIDKQVCICVCVCRQKGQRYRSGLRALIFDSIQRLKQWEERDRLWLILLLWHDEIITTEQLTRVVMFFLFGLPWTSWGVCKPYLRFHVTRFQLLQLLPPQMVGQINSCRITWRC